VPQPHHDVLDQDRIAQLIATPRGEDPVVTLYLQAWGPAGARKVSLKNLVKEAEGAIEGDTGWDADRKKQARKLLDDLRARAEQELAHCPNQGRGAIAMFMRADGLETIRLPIDVRERIVVDRTPYASPLSSLIDQYERYGVILCDQKRARLFEVYLGVVDAWEEIESEHEPKRKIPAGGPARTAMRSVAAGGQGKGGYHGLEELRRRNHAEYVLHQHLADVADRAFRRFKLRPFDRLILGGPKELLPKLEEQLHSYLQERVVAREDVPVDLSREKARERVLEIEAKVEAEKEAGLLKSVGDRLGKSGLATTGLDQTLESLFFGKVHTLIVLDGDERPGRECPECHYLFARPEDQGEKTPTLVECPICKRPTRRVPDIIDEAVELAILSGARVEHVAYAKADLEELGGVAALLRFK